MSFLKNKIIRIFLGILVAIIFMTSIATHGDNPIQKAANTIMTPLFSLGSYVVTPIRKFVDNVKNASGYEKEIESLKAKVNLLEAQSKTREEYIEENERLKELLDIKDGMMKNYETVTARVVSYEPNSWYDTVMINKGKKHGIDKEDIVINTLGVVGKVTEVGPNWARLSTILNISNSVGVKLARTGDIGVVSGDAALAEDKNCKLEYLSNEKNLIVGDILLTSGLSGIYPPDLSVGKIIDIKSDSAGNLSYAQVEPSVDFSALYEVLVIVNAEDVEVFEEAATSNSETEEAEQVENNQAD